MKKPIQPQLFSRGRIIGLRLTDEEFQRLEAAAGEERKKIPTYRAHGHRGMLSAFIRGQLQNVLHPPEITHSMPADIAKKPAASTRSTNTPSSKRKKNRGSAKARHRRSGRSVPKTARKSRR